MTDAAVPTLPSGSLSKRPDDWWKSAVVYQIYPRSFADSNGDGTGDIPGITEHVDHLAQLGVDVVWLSPVYASPMDDNGYDISDYHDVDPLFGTLEDLDRLIAALHDRGLKLVMDLVVNHTSDEHAWFIESRDPASPKRDWYWWRPAREGFEPGTPGAEPTNAEAAFSGSVWQYDEASGEYYLHLFSPKQPDLNWENPEVRQAVYDMMRWWVDRGVDGFRMDVINLISKPTGELTDGEVPPGRRFAPSLGLVANGPRLDEFLAEMNSAVGLSAQNLLTVGEMPGSTIEVARRATDPARNELNMVFTFEHVDLDQQPGGVKWDLAELSLPVLKRKLAEWQDGLADVGWNSLYWNNHDQPRAVSRFGDDSAEFRAASAKTLGTVLHLHKGTPYIYQGEELGMTNTYYSEIAHYADLESINYHAEALSLGMEAEAIMKSLQVKSRDNARSPMQWSDTPHGGFTEGVPWLAVERELRHDQRRRGGQRPGLGVPSLPQADRASPRRIPWSWTADSSCCWPTMISSGRSPGPVMISELLVLANCSSRRLSCLRDGLPSLEGAEVWLADACGSRRGELAPWESRVLLLG